MQNIILLMVATLWVSCIGYVCFNSSGLDKDISIVLEQSGHFKK